MGDAIAALQEKLGADVVKGPQEADFARHRRDFNCAALDSVILLGAAYPRSTQEVSEIMRICHALNVTVAPQGGMTGMAGGGVPVKPCLILSLERMRKIEEVDRDAATMTVEAGVALESVQNAADAAELFFPLDLGARGSAHIAGNASTNAGGNRVIRYGMMRDLVLGVEAVLADGTIVSAMNKMLKNNAGYDLKHLFIGSEGTLGIVTRLVLRLYPKPRSVSTGVVAVADYDHVLQLLRHCASRLGSNLCAFEAMWPDFYFLGTKALGRQPPIAEGHGVYVLVETLGTDQQADQARFEEVIAGAIEDGIVEDAVIAQSGKERERLWAIRDCPGEFPKTHWPQLAFDVSMPIGVIGDFIVECDAALRARWPSIFPVAFGHIGDSNLHLSVKYDESIDPYEVEDMVYRTVGARSGSISAEHGIGLVKRDFLHYSRSEAELTLMRTIKHALDPKNILNPGKVI